MAQGVYPNFHRANVSKNFFSVNASYLLGTAWTSPTVMFRHVRSIAAFKRLLKRSDLSDFMYFHAVEVLCSCVFFIFKNF